MLPGDDGASICGPSLIKVPDWAPNRLGAYYLYFAHHRGTSIRLAYAESITGPWTIHPGGALSLQDCRFTRDHIASPDVHIDHEQRLFVMYFHGVPVGIKGQRTFRATSADGLAFVGHPHPIGPPYARFFHHDGWWYGLLGTGLVRLQRAQRGIADFTTGPIVMDDPWLGRISARHLAVQKTGQTLKVFYTRVGDAPERIFAGKIDLTGDWLKWRLRGQAEVLRPEMDYEGADLPLKTSRRGMPPGRENALRDPAIYEEDGRTWLLYSIAGESGIALAEIAPGAADPRGSANPLAGPGRRSARMRLRSLRSRLNRIWQGRRKEPTRIFIAGCARSGTSLTLRLMRCFDDGYIAPREASARTLSGLRRSESLLVVKRTAKCFARLHRLPKRIGLVYCVRHPFDVLTSSHPESRHLRRFHVTPERWLAEYEALCKLRKTQPERAILYQRYEDLVADADAAQQRMIERFGIAPRLRFSEDTSNPVRTTSLRKWESQPQLLAYLYGLPEDFLAQVRRFCQEFGYELPPKPTAL
jgi:hypothetical protein